MSKLYIVVTVPGLMYLPPLDPAGYFPCYMNVIRREDADIDPVKDTDGLYATWHKGYICFCRRL